MDFAETLLKRSKFDFLAQTPDEVRNSARYVLADLEVPKYPLEDALKLVSVTIAAYLAGRDYLDAVLDSDDYQLKLDLELAFDEAYKRAVRVVRPILHPCPEEFKDEEA